MNASTETVPEKPDGNMYQPFPRSKSPYDVGPHGLYNLGESDELPPPLPPAVPGLVYGRTKQGTSQHYFSDPTRVRNS